MKKFITLFLLVFTLNIALIGAEGFYICRNTDDCAMYVIEDSEGFSWYIECMDGSTEAGRTNGAEYGGNCEKMEI